MNLTADLAGEKRRLAPLATSKTNQTNRGNFYEPRNPTTNMSEWIAFKHRPPQALSAVFVANQKTGERRFISSWLERFDGMTHWQPAPEPPPKPDPFEEWWGDLTCGWKVVSGYQVTKCEARVIFNAGLEAGGKEK